MGDYYDPSGNGGYLGKTDSKGKEETQAKPDKTTIDISGCGCVMALFIICATIIILTMILMNYHF